MSDTNPRKINFCFIYCLRMDILRELYMEIVYNIMHGEYTTNEKRKHMENYCCGFIHPPYPDIFCTYAFYKITTV